MNRLFLTGLILFMLLSCREATVPPRQMEVFEWDFQNDAEGWAGDFADYPVGREDFFELEFSHDTLPEPLDQNQMALKLSGRNHSDDLFMYVKRRITGLLPEAVYFVSFIVEFASNVPDGLAGIGGSPGESVYVKAGATQIEPIRIIDDMDNYRMNIDKANQSQSGDDMIVIGDFSNNTDEEVYTLKTVQNDDESFAVQSNSSGELWIIIGTESGFMGTTTIYYNSIRVELHW
jgi:hypothetical protein